MNQPDPATYPCPACNSPANLATGCPGCGRGPDPEAAEVMRLGGAIERLAGEVERARQGYAEAVERLRDAQLRRNELAARVRASVTVQQTPAPVPAAPMPAPEPAPTPSARPEASTRTTQNVLFILGGLLLASAAIVFTAVAWARFGVVGRASILGVVTALTLAAPPVALLRRLSGTAETFAALGLLLVLLDGYAAWYVNLAGVHAMRPATYAGVVCATTACVALGYGVVTRLTGPRFLALVVAQPVLPLFVLHAGFGMAGWAGVLTVLAAANLAVARWANRARALSIVAWTLTGVALVSAAGPLLGALISGDAYGPAIRTGLVLILAAAVVVAAAMAGPVPVLRHVAAGAAALAVVIAGARVALVGRPAWGLALVAAEIAALAVVVRALPVRVRTGPRAGILAAAGLPGLGVVAWALLLGLDAAEAALPVWHAELQPPAASNWWVPPAIVLLGVAIAVLLPRGATAEAAVGTGAVLALALPGVIGLPWWAASLVAGMVALPLALASVTARSVRRTLVYGVPAGLLAAHSVAAGLARPASTAGVLAALVAVGTGVAVLGRNRQRIVGAVGAGVALLALPFLLAAIAATAGATPATVRAFTAAGLALAVVAVVIPRGRLPEYAVSGALAVLLGGAGLTLSAVAATPLPYGVYAGVAVLCDAVAVLAVLPILRDRPWTGPAAAVAVTVPAGPALASVVPATWAVLAGPYAWVHKVWSGTPTGIGLGVDAPVAPYAFGPAAATLALFALALLVASRAGRPALTWAVVPATPAILATAAALQAPWPTVAALSLAIGAGAALVGALRRSSPALGAVALIATGAGLAGALPTRAATLTALAVVLVASALCGLAGRVRIAREAGWLVAAASAAGLALAAALTADVAVRWAALWVLGAAAVTLAVSALLTCSGRVEGRLVEGAAHATAFVALLLTIPAIRHSAGVCTLWGVALGLRALLPGEAAAGRRVRVAAAATIELVAYWLLLVASAVATLEAYTLPAAGVALLAGWLAARTRPGLHSWSAYGPALLAGFAPSAATLLGGAGEPARRFALGAAAVIVVVVGSLRRRQAPVVVGGTVLALVAVHEVVRFWDLVPRWIPLAVAGLLLVGLATTYERRRRDMARLREAVGRMR
ncbi:hypothetical protein HC028_20495 [Planosporangium flavigriseum]|uniref:Uncharacterized protein n=1 Tax=Planosporangium flavigriseum TaxID=373681 RepID=A0A8J3PMK0_9ACTN|nr:hypothetical protein [Planosporangium flavigriseum]NJC66867.1 hypothetical protein [Planosporangium flavigriseum]GIG74389.1 hypothetical protein Pfl04_27930 [Planosporangium flavigriseum]